MATTNEFLLAGFSIVFSSGVAYGMIRVMIEHLYDADDGIKEVVEKNKAEISRRMDKFEAEDCEDIVRKLLFDDSAMPRFMPISQCLRQHADFAKQLEKLESKIDARDKDMMHMLDSIHREVTK